MALVSFFAENSCVRNYLLRRVHIHALGEILWCRDGGRLLLKLLQASRQLLVGLLQPGRNCCCLCQLLLQCPSLTKTKPPSSIPAIEVTLLTMLSDKRNAEGASHRIQGALLALWLTCMLHGCSQI